MAGKWKGLAIPKSTGMEEWQEKFLAQQKEFAEIFDANKAGLRLK